MIKTIILDWSGVVSDDWIATFKTSNDVLEEPNFIIEDLGKLPALIEKIEEQEVVTTND